jgi:outer membrane protein OmpA-like peptidoglycan-associated protein
MHLPPRLTRLNPATAAPGDPVEIIGTDLGVKRRENDRVTINGVTVEPPPDAWQDESIVVQVPKTLGPRRAMIRVVARGHTSNALAVKIARNGPPVAAFSSRSDRSARSFLLDASGSRDPEGKPLSYGWRSRGNTLGREKTQPITLPKGHRSTAVTLTVTDDRGQRATAKRTVSLGVDRITLLNDATFSFGKTTLTGAGRTRIAELRSRLRGQAGTIERIDISGYADFAGTSRFNLDLSLQRAEAVRAALMKDLKPVRPVKVNGYGESRARAKTWNDPRRGRDRRVDIKVTLQR